MGEKVTGIDSRFQALLAGRNNGTGIGGVGVGVAVARWRTWTMVEGMLPLGALGCRFQGGK